MRINVCTYVFMDITLNGCIAIGASLFIALLNIERTDRTAHVLAIPNFDFWLATSFPCNSAPPDTRKAEIKESLEANGHRVHALKRQRNNIQLSI